MGKNAYTDRFLKVVFEIIKPKTKKDFAESIGLNKSKFRNIEAGDNGVTADALCKFLETYKNINANYILTGRGSMFNQEHEAGGEDIDNPEHTILRLQEELSNAYSEIELLIGKLKAAEEHKTSQKIG